MPFLLRKGRIFFASPPMVLVDVPRVGHGPEELVVVAGHGACEVQVGARPGCRRREALLHLAENALVPLLVLEVGGRRPVLVRLDDHAHPARLAALLV